MTLRTLALVATSIATLSACTPQPDPISAEPVFDKYGNPSCRPYDQPIGGVFTADLPICSVVAAPAAATAATAPATDHDGTETAGTSPGSTPGTGGVTGGNQNQNNNQNQNQNNNQSQGGNQSQSGSGS